MEQVVLRNFASLHSNLCYSYG